jgi:hypothetical protein
MSNSPEVMMRKYEIENNGRSPHPSLRGMREAANYIIYVKTDDNPAVLNGEYAITSM